MIESIWGLLGIGLSAFLSATLLPGNSELSLSAFIYQWPQDFWIAVAVATTANTIGSVVNMIIGRYFKKNKQISIKIHNWFNRYGSVVLLLSWLPVIGDVLPLVAGWLRLSWLPCCIWLMIGKLMRYLVVGYSALILVT